jgi:hypothetical protein
VCRHDPDKAVVGRWIARRRSGLLAERAHHQVGRHRGAGAAARTAGAAAGVVRIAGRAAERAAVAGGVFAHVRLGENDGASLTQTRHHLGVARWTIVGVVRRRTAGGAHVKRVELVLDGKRNAMQRPLEPPGAPELRVELLCDFQCIGHGRVAVSAVGLRPLAALIDGDESVELPGILDRLDIAELKARHGIDCALYAGAVIGRDALEIVVHELACGELARHDGAMHIGDGRLLQTESTTLSAGRISRQHADCRRKCKHARRDAAHTRTGKSHGIPSLLANGRRHATPSARESGTASSVN